MVCSGEPMARGAQPHTPIILLLGNAHSFKSVISKKYKHRLTSDSVYYSLFLYGFSVYLNNSLT